MSDPIPVESTALDVVRDAPVEVHRQGFNRDQVELIKRTICAGSTDDELALFIKVAERTGLDPFARQIHAVKRWDQEKGHVMSIQVGIDGFRLIAERTRRYAGRLGPYWCGEDGEWLMDDKGRPKPWLKATPPSAAMVGVRHRDYVEPLYAIATWASYVQTKKGGQVTHMWATKGDLMLAKCAEALALRGAFPAELSGLYTDDEMGQAHASVDVPHEDPEAWFPSNGWKDRAEHDEAVRGVIAQVKASPDDVREAFRVWFDDQEFTFRMAWPRPFFDVVIARLEAMLSERPDQTPEGEGPPNPAPTLETPAPAPESAPVADSEPLPEPDPTTMALIAIAFVESLPARLVGEALEARNAALSGASKVRQQRLAKLLAGEGWTPGRGHLPVAEPAATVPPGLPEPKCAWCGHRESTKGALPVNGEGGWMHDEPCRPEWVADKAAAEEPF